MLTMILLAVMTSRGVPTFTVDQTVYVTGRPGCTVVALHNDPTMPVVVCSR